MFDCHAHTNRSYCAETELYLSVYAEKIKNTEDIDGIAITDHSMAIYFPVEVAWSWVFMDDSSIFDKYRDWGNKRLEKHFAEISKYRNVGIIPGLEVEMMNDGRLTFDDAFRKRIEILIGSVHTLSNSVGTGSNPEKVIEEWRQHNFRLLNTGIDILGHPFRWLQGQMEDIPRALIRELVSEAKKAKVALELNSHCIVPADEIMLVEALNLGAMIAFGTDSHRIDEVGDFSYHRHILKKAGIDFKQMKCFIPPIPLFHLDKI